MADKHILIVGAGVAGPMLAYWLSRGGFKVTVIERSSKLYKAGQGIDINGPAQEIVEKMPGVMEQIKERTTGEQGFAVVDDNAREVASIPGGLTQEIEIMRGEMVEVFTKAAEDLGNVEFRYDTTIEHIEQSDDCVTATFGKSVNGEQASYHALVGADGMRSRTRELALDPDDVRDCFKARDQYIAYFTIPRKDEDSPNSVLQQAEGGRQIIVRPVDKERSSAYVGVVGQSDDLERAISEGKERQKEIIAGLFQDVGGEGPRVIGDMLDADDFYFERIAQVKLSSWHKGRVALVGDAAGAPSPITGEGTNVAIVLAYVLAGELTEHAADPEAAFEAYKAQLHSYVEKVQTIPLGGKAPELLNPQSSWGISRFRAMFKAIAATGAWKLPMLNLGEPDKLDLPHYPKLNGNSWGAAVVG